VAMVGMVVGGAGSEPAGVVIRRHYKHKERAASQLVVQGGVRKDGTRTPMNVVVWKQKKGGEKNGIERPVQWGVRRTSEC